MSRIMPLRQSRAESPLQARNSILADMNIGVRIEHTLADTSAGRDADGGPHGSATLGGALYSSHAT